MLTRFLASCAILLLGLDEMAPVKTIKLRKNYASWLTKETRTLLTERDNAQKHAATTKNQDDWRLYKNLRNRATSKMREEKKQWEKGCLNHLENNSTNIWINMKTWLNWKVSGPSTQLFYGGQTIRSPANLADTMNAYFTQKVQILRENIPQGQQDPLVKMREVMRDRDCQFTFRPVKPDEVLKIVQGLKNSKSTGLDNVDT